MIWVVLKVIIHKHLINGAFISRNIVSICSVNIVLNNSLLCSFKESDQAVSACFTR